MDRRPLAALLALGLMAAVPVAAAAQSPSALLAQTPSGTLAAEPSDLMAQTPKGTLSDTPTGSESKGSGGSSPSEGSSRPTATAATLPFTGSDPRVMLLLGVAAVLAGAGLRLRTGDARDF